MRQSRIYLCIKHDELFASDIGSTLKISAQLWLVSSSTSTASTSVLRLPGTGVMRSDL